MHKSQSIRQFSTILIVGISLMFPSLAWAEKPSIASPSDRLACMNALVDSPKYSTFDDLNDLRSNRLEEIDKCSFSELATIRELSAALGKTKAGAEAARGLKKMSFSDAKTTIKPGQEILDEILPVFELALGSIGKIESAKTDPRFQVYTNAVSRVIRMSPSLPVDGLEGPGLKASDLISKYSAYGRLKLWELVTVGDKKSCNLDESTPICTFNFAPWVQDSNNSFSLDRTYPFDFPLLQETNTFVVDGKLCEQTCRDYIELLLFTRVWHAFWSTNSEVMYVETLKKISDSINEYDNFFFEAGDGLYPWELWANSYNKSDNIFEVPSKKWNLLHPSPIVYYNDADGNIDPSILVELVGVTWLNYNSGKNGSFPLGLAAVADFENDKIRFGGMVHLPIRGGLNRLGLNTAAKLMPCEVCSVAFVTDGDGEWSVGVKINVAQLLFDKKRSQKLYQSFLKK